MARRRADAALVDAGLFASREQAKAAIMAGRVRIAGAVVAKPGSDVTADVLFEVEPAQEYVSRGGHKLAGALDHFGVDVAGLSVVDVGASTGGFTDCVLQRGAARVTAIDVGYGQLAWKLRSDPRVTVLERTNIRAVEGVVEGAPFDIAVIDVSFIGLAKVLPHVADLLTEHGEIVALVKPQFEAGKGRVGKRGVVRDAGVHADVLRAVFDAALAGGWIVSGMTWSPLKGPEGNIEFWVRLVREGVPTDEAADDIVRAAHEALGGL
ncbi:MAG: TlyA family RNA methyltransferase [Coriobacteriia bacterium]|nr:TlyA family RNA methyltransferase [Coriobacteriia bacterium]